MEQPTPTEVVSVEQPTSPVTPEQATEPVGTPATAPTSDEAKHFQRIAEERQIEVYRERQARENLERQMQEFMQRSQVSDQNPHNPQENYIQWNKWETEKAIERAVQKSSQAYEQKFAGLVQRASETQWQAQHPNVNIEAVKAFASMRQIGNLDDAYTLMTLPQTVQQTYQHVTQQAFNQFQKPQPGSMPLRGAESPAIKAGVTFEQTLKDWTKDPSIEERWSPEFRADFERELKARQQIYRTQG